MFKYGLYEIFKNLYNKTTGEKLQKYQIVGYALSSASAELVADIFLCPWESIKIRMQTQVFNKFPNKLIPATRLMYS